MVLSFHIRNHPVATPPLYGDAVKMYKCSVSSSTLRRSNFESVIHGMQSALFAYFRSRSTVERLEVVPVWSRNLHAFALEGSRSDSLRAGCGISQASVKHALVEQYLQFATIV